MPVPLKVTGISPGCLSYTALYQAALLALVFYAVLTFFVKALVGFAEMQRA